VETLSPPSDVQHLPESLTDPTSRKGYEESHAENFVQDRLKRMATDSGKKDPVDEQSRLVTGVEKSLRDDGATTKAGGPAAAECWTYIWSANLSGLNPELWE
jgi:hypothetical protein